MSGAEAKGFTSAFGEVLQDELGDMTERLKAQRERLIAAQRELNSRTTTVRSKDRTVSVTVGARGEVRDIRFHTEDYRAMDPARLSRALVEIVTRAQQQAAKEAYEAFAPLRGAGAEMRRSMEAGTAIGDLLAPLRALTGDPFAGRRDGDGGGDA
ncbi:YbaB/EbfC family nucleoid-associated protein [Streptomyces sp. NPDC057197]|uniref:YbaB/EbfC family nucleoid-associated protein n=1 Tax=Streptomyces sp. NPDC057197 TaxID=3346045 RepID=UPI0036443BAA